MDVTYTTRDRHPSAGRQSWQEAVARTYFPLDLKFRPGSFFDGTLDHWSLGEVSISRNESDALLYRRHERHLLHERDESFLVTVPMKSEIRFEQDGRDVSCRPGAFLIERSHLPYEFSHAARNTLWVLKVPSAMLRGRIGRPERLATMQFDATRGVGAIFIDTLRLTAMRLGEIDQAARNLIGTQIVDLLAFAVEADDRVLSGTQTSVRSGHLLRAEHFVRDRLRDPSLSPRMVAAACGISLRYLQQLFEGHDTSVAGYIRTQRLRMCDEALRDPHRHAAISAVAYDWGFTDQAQFSRSYRALFGRSPSETRNAARNAGGSLPENGAAHRDAHDLGGECASAQIFSRNAPRAQRRKVL